jgi:hypothetical protein
MQKSNGKSKVTPEVKPQQKFDVVLKEGTALVMCDFYCVDPFEGTVFQSGVETPTPLTNWVKSQISAKFLKVIDSK